MVVFFASSTDIYGEYRLVAMHYVLTILQSYIVHNLHFSRDQVIP